MFNNEVIRYTFILIFAAMTFLVTGCKSPMQKMLGQAGYWEQAAQRMASKRNSDASGLVREVFPDLENPIHSEVWKALWDKRRVGDGFGYICNYYGFYLVTVSQFHDHGRLSSFYNPTSHFVLKGNEDDVAFHLYGGDKNATTGNIRRLVENLLAVSGYEAFVVDDWNQIPHTRFQEDNPKLPFVEFLAAKGITIRPASILKKNERADDNGYSECSVFAYMPCGGQVFRYEVRCKSGLITGFKRFLLGSDIGDCWYIM